MKMDEIESEISFMLGFPANDNIEGLDIKQAVKIAFRELKKYMKTPVDKTVPFSRRIDLLKVGINATKILYVQAARPRIGLTMGSIDSGNVFQVAAAVNTQSMIGNTSKFNLDPIMSEMGMAQVRNTLSTDFQWRWDSNNQVVYCAHRDPRPVSVTIRYVPNYKDVSEIQNPTYQDYLVRMATANMKIALGRARSKYKIPGSNVELDGEILLSEGNAELEQIREELNQNRQKLTVLN